MRRIGSRWSKKPSIGCWRIRAKGSLHALGAIADTPAEQAFIAAIVASANERLAFHMAVHRALRVHRRACHARRRSARCDASLTHGRWRLGGIPARYASTHLLLSRFGRISMVPDVGCRPDLSPRWMMYAGGPPICPTCGQLDQVRKASALYDSGTTFSPNHGYHWSNLALRMQPPALPEPRRRASTCLGWLLIPLVLLVGSCLLLDALRVTLGTALPLADTLRQLAGPGADHAGRLRRLGAGALAGAAGLCRAARAVCGRAARLGRALLLPAL